MGNINLGQASRLNLDKFGISNYIPARAFLIPDIGNIKLGETSRFNLDKFGIDSDIPDCRSGTVRINYRPTHLGQDPFNTTHLVQHILK